ncbi:MAG: ABC transporter ATP-binding protein [Firmicutes bacterium]|nr:ABC transporter ATP-binding protein [Bacillota bacterium]
MASVEIKNLVYSSASGRSPLFGVSLEIADSEFFAIAGFSGSGKSTLLRLIAGLEKPENGEILLNGKIANEGTKERNMAMSFQNFELFKQKSVYNNLAYGLRLRKIENEVIKEKVEKTIDFFGLKEIANLKPKKLSLYQKRLVALARCSIREVGVILLDEPTNGLEENEAKMLLDEIVRWHKTTQTTIICTTFNPLEIIDCADKLAIIKNGEILQAGTPKEVHENPINDFIAAFID